MTSAYINRIATAVPPYDVHDTFVRYARTLFGDRHRRALIDRMVERARISHRWSSLPPAADPEGAAVDADGFYVRGRFPSTAVRMRRFEREASGLAAEAVAGLGLGQAVERISHVVVTSCTGFSAPGIDLEVVTRCGIDPGVERTLIGFMGCYAAINALKVARHIVRSEPQAHVLVLNLELCTLHLQETADLQQLRSFLIFGDGCAAALVTAEPRGLELERFHAIFIPETADLITWHIRDLGFDMGLSARVPGTLGEGLRASAGSILNGTPREAIDLWAVHPGGRAVLEAVEGALELAPTALAASRRVLDGYGNMSSATVMFVLEALMHEARPGALGCGMAFGPGLVAETMLFRAAGRS